MGMNFLNFQDFRKETTADEMCNSHRNVKKTVDDGTGKPEASEIQNSLLTLANLLI